MAKESFPKKQRSKAFFLDEVGGAVYDSVKEREDNVIGSRIQAVREERGLSLTGFAELLSRCGLTIHRQGISKWENGGSVPNAYQLLAICHALKIEDGVAFFTREPKRPDELNEEGHRKLSDYRADLVASGRYKPYVPAAEGKIEYIYMNVSTIAASAVTGEYLDEENFEKVRFPASAVPQGADFGVWVNGNSMEPVYHDHQIVWIQQCEELWPGVVGLFMYDGNGYIKVYDERITEASGFDGEDGAEYVCPVLVSYNEDYEPIYVNLDLGFRVVGRVLN